MCCLGSSRTFTEFMMVDQPVRGARPTSMTDLILAIGIGQKCRRKKKMSRPTSITKIFAKAMISIICENLNLIQYSWWMKFNLVKVVMSASWLFVRLNINSHLIQCLPHLLHSFSSHSTHSRFAWPLSCAPRSRTVNSSYPLQRVGSLTRYHELCH